MMKLLVVILCLFSTCCAEIKAVIFDCCTAVNKDDPSTFAPLENTFFFYQWLAEEKEALDIKIGIVATAPREYVVEQLQNLGIAHWCDTIVSNADEIAICRKANPSLYLRAAKNFGALPEECLAIVNSKDEAASAFTAGCKTVALAHPSRREEDFANVDLVLETLSDISPQELLSRFNE